jgi:hypothetical protein
MQIKVAEGYKDLTARAAYIYRSEKVNAGACLGCLTMKGPMKYAGGNYCLPCFSGTPVDNDDAEITAMLRDASLAYGDKDAARDREAGIL